MQEEHILVLFTDDEWRVRYNGQEGIGETLYEALFDLAYVLRDEGK